MLLGTWVWPTGIYVMRSHQGCDGDQLHIPVLLTPSAAQWISGSKGEQGEMASCKQFSMVSSSAMFLGSKEEILYFVFQNFNLILVRWDHSKLLKPIIPEVFILILILFNIFMESLVDHLGILSEVLPIDGCHPFLSLLTDCTCWVCGSPEEVMAGWMRASKLKLSPD